ncbi:MAG TPA: glycoside hydrolase family 97 N-terminal domain-containing protein [Chitinophagaceae bacterium]|jgi:hypothetical protein|nr:glycoside hydrolase family 97 N-terminal domain-containing protein [Chitinophagaceae bacterium]
MIKRFSSYGLVFILSFYCFLSNAQKSVIVKNTDKRLSVTVALSKEGQPYYTVTHNSELLLEDSKLAIIWQDNDFSKNLTLLSACSTKKVKDDYVMINTKKKIFIMKQIKRNRVILWL